MLFPNFVLEDIKNATFSIRRFTVLVSSTMFWFLSAEDEPISSVLNNFSPRGRQKYRTGNVKLLVSSAMTNSSSDLLHNRHLEARKLM
jgi:hypothetical protein